jgi:tetratricopeptide (TPR) repeat protein
MLAAYDVITPDEGFPKAKSAATRALEIDPSLAEAHASLAYAVFLHDWDWDKAERGYRRALELDPNYAMAHVWYGIFLAVLGRGDEAIAEADLAMTLDPLSLIIGAMRGWVLYLSGDIDGSIEQCQETLELDQSFYPAHMIVARSYERAGMCEKAVQAAEMAARLSQSPSMLPEVAYTYGACGEEKRALDVKKRIEEHFTDSYFLAINMSLVETGLGNTDEALTWLEKATDDRYPWMVQLRVEPRWALLREDPRFEVLAKRIGL